MKKLYTSGLVMFIIGLIVASIVMQMINLDEITTIVLAIAGTLIAGILIHLGFGQLGALICGLVFGMMIEIFTFFTSYNPFLQIHTPHLASLATQNQTSELDLGKLAFFGLFTIFLIATGHGFFSRVKNENLNKREERTLRFLRIIWFIFLVIFICLLILMI